MFKALGFWLYSKYYWVKTYKRRRDDDRFIY